MQTPHPFGSLLREMLSRRDLTHEAFALRLGVARSAVSQWCSGDVAPDTRRLPAILAVLGADDAERSAVESAFACALGFGAVTIPAPAAE